MTKAKKRRQSILRSLIILGVIIIAVAGGWYLLRPQSEVRSTAENVSTPSKTRSIDGREQPGRLAPDFSLTDLDRTAFQLSDFRGSVVVIDFMATWCGPCRQEMPHYGIVWEKYGNKIVLMSIDIDPRETEEALRDLAREFPYATWIWAMDTANLGQVYQVAFIPKTVVIDQDGYIRFEHTGVTPASTFVQEIDQLLG